MKNTIKWSLMITVFFYGVENSFAQDNDQERYERGVHLGPKLGLNYSNVFDERGDEFVAKSTFGLVGGGFVSFPIGLHFAVQPEILFSQKGFKANGSILGLDYQLRRTSSFIDVPLFFAWRPVRFITLMAGPQFSYLINQKDVFTSSSNSYSVEQEFKNEDVRKNMLCFVGGMDININYLVFGMRAGFDFQENQGNGNNSVPRYKNVWLQGTVGFRF